MVKTGPVVEVKFVIEQHEDMHRLVEWYGQNIISADEYFDAVNEYSKIVIRREIEAERRK